MDGWGKSFVYVALLYSTLGYARLRYAALSVNWFRRWVGWVCDVLGDFQKRREGIRAGGRGEGGRE